MNLYHVENCERKKTIDQKNLQFRNVLWTRDDEQTRATIENMQIKWKISGYCSLGMPIDNLIGRITVNQSA